MGKRKHDDETPGKEKKSAKKQKKEKKKRKIKKEETAVEEEQHVAESPQREQQPQGETAPTTEESAIKEETPKSAIDSAGRVRSDSMTLEMSYDDLTGNNNQEDSAVDLSGDTYTNSSPSNNKSNNKPIFFRKRVQLTVSLLPYSMRNCEASIREAIRKQLLRHSDGWDGIMLAFDNLKYRDRNSSSKNISSKGGKGWILNELPYIHYEVDCDVLVFAPSVGCELQGVVSACFPSHVSMLVFGYINAMVPSDTFLKAGYKFDDVLDNWVKEIGSETITKGTKINFTVSKIHECEGAISLEGKKASIALMMES